MSRKKRPGPPPFSEAAVDSHCHLDPETWGGDDGVDAVVARALAAGVGGMVAIGAGWGLAAVPAAVAVARRHPAHVRATVGLHPHEARLGDAAAWRALAEGARLPEVVGWGEVGLDFHYDLSPRDVQRDALRRQVGLALEAGLPLVIHDRESGGETLAILEQEGAFSAGRVLFHCFSGGVAEAEAVVALGGWISLPGVVTWRRAEETREVARRVPAERLVVETDAPYLAPEPWRGHRNEPALLPHTLAVVAAVRGTDLDHAVRTTAESARRFFGLPPEWGQRPG